MLPSLPVFYGILVFFSGGRCGQGFDQMKRSIFDIPSDNLSLTKAKFEDVVGLSLIFVFCIFPPVHGGNPNLFIAKQAANSPRTHGADSFVLPGMVGASNHAPNY